MTTATIRQPLQVGCAACGRRSTVSPRLAGRQLLCRGCGGTVQVPSAELAPAAEPSPRGRAPAGPRSSASHTDRQPCDACHVLVPASVLARAFDGLLVCGVCRNASNQALADPLRMARPAAATRRRRLAPEQLAGYFALFSAGSAGLIHTFWAPGLAPTLTLACGIGLFGLLPLLRDVQRR